MKSIEVVLCLALALPGAGCSTADPGPGRSYEMGSDRYGPIPPADPGRTISRQDCTQPLTLDGGNLMCM